MSGNPLKFALFGNEYQDVRSDVVPRLLACLAEKGAEVSIESDYYRCLSARNEVRKGAVKVFSGHEFDADFVISLGGDGTFLRVVDGLIGRDIPLIGINTGRLGFLSDVRSADVETALDAVFRGDYTLESRSVLMAEADGKPLSGRPYALNDIAILKRDDASMINIRTKIDGEHAVTYMADGLIVSTPSGSTAYSLSNGGPIVAPQTHVVCLTPVAPHSLTIRPIVLPDNVEIAIEVESRSRHFLVAIDGRSMTCEEHIGLTIRKASQDVKLVKRHGQSYFDTLRQKMMWGQDTREETCE